MASADILTGQFVSIEQTPASVGDRIFARFIDFLVRGAYFIGMLILLGMLSPQKGGDDAFYLIAALVVFIPVMFYTFLCELFFNGQTFGKRVMKIRTVMADGSRPTLGALFLRWLLELIDISFFVVGILPIIVTKRHQRLGDLAAGTMVIRCPDIAQMHISLSEFQYAMPDYKPKYAKASILTPGQAELIERVVKIADRHGYYDEDNVSRLAEKVAKTVKARGRFHGLPFLRHVLNDYRYFTLNEV